MSQNHPPPPERSTTTGGLSSQNQQPFSTMPPVTGGPSDQTTQPCPTFSHPAEEVFAHILDYYGVEWKYEPRTFPLEWDENQNVIEAFTPDFYLPQQDLYVELTTLRPKLSNKKNRRMRRMKELYPEVNIKLFKRREMRDLMVKYGLYQEAHQIRGTQAQEVEE